MLHNWLVSKAVLDERIEKREKGAGYANKGGILAGRENAIQVQRL